MGLRRCGYKGRLISFEPDSRSFPVLSRQAANDPLWSAVHLACSNVDGKAHLQLAANEVSSSLRTVTHLHVNSAPQSANVGVQTVATQRLDHWLDREGVTSLSELFVKVDVQGAELDVLDGLGDFASHVAGFQMEVSFRPLYEGAPTYLDVLQRLDALGFVPCSVAPVFLSRQTGLCLQADITFVHRGMVEQFSDG